MNNKMFRTMVLAAGAALFNLFASAQMPGGSSDAVNSAIIKLFGDSTAFTGHATVQVLNSNRVEWLRMPATFTGLVGKLRFDIDRSQFTGPAVDPKAAPVDKRFGTDRISTVTRPDTKVSYIIYPNAHSYVRTPLFGADVDLANQKLIRTSLGHAKIDGHSCVKNHSVVKNQNGETLLDATTWNATDLQDFPIQIEMKEKDRGNITVIHFQQVSLARPDSRLFEPPPGFQAFNTPEELVGAMMKKAAANQNK